MDKKKKNTQGGWQMHSDKVKYSVKYKLFMLSATVAVPFLVMVVYLIYSMHSYSNA